MDIHNLSLHLDKPISHDTQVFVATSAPNFVDPKQYQAWRERMIKYIQNRRKSMDIAKERHNKYSIVYVPKVYADDDDPVVEPEIVPATNQADEETNDRDILFIVKRPDAFDGPEDIFKDLYLDGQYAVIVIHSIGDIAEKTVCEKLSLDIVPHSLRLFGWFLLFIGGVVASQIIIKNNPYSVIGL